MTENEALQYFTKKVRRKSEFEQYRELILNAYQRYPGITQKRIYEMLTERYPDRYTLSSCPICITITFFEEGNETIVDFYKEKVVIKTKEGEDLLYVKPGKDGKIFAGDQTILYIHNLKGGIDYLLVDKKEIKQEGEEEMETEQKQPTIEDVIIKPIKDSGKRYTNEHGGMRDTDEGKPKFKYIDASFLDKVTEADALYYENMVYEISYEKVLDAISFKDPDHNKYCRYEIIMIATSILLVCVEDESWSQQSLYEGLSKFALFMEEGAKKYSFENWKLLNTPEDIERFKESCYRHYIQWRLEEDDENHQMATVFNLMALFYHLKEEKPIMNLADFIKQPYVPCYE